MVEGRAPATQQRGAVNRAYTIRQLTGRTLVIDFVLHGDAAHDKGGGVSAWARSAAVGDIVHVGNPRGGYPLDPDARWRLLAGDETALPAIATILEALPEDSTPTHVVIEVPSKHDVQPLRLPQTADIYWLARDESDAAPGSLLEKTIASRPLSSDLGQVFLAGEATAVRNIKRDIAGRAPQARMEAKGYWLLGQPDHKEKNE